MFFSRFLTLIMYICLLSACVATSTSKDNMTHANQNNAHPSPPAQDTSTDILDFMTQYIALKPEQQKRMHQDVIKVLSNQHNNHQLLIKKATMLSLPNSAVRNTTDAITLLKTLKNDPSLSAADANLVAILFIFTKENSELEDKVNVNTENNTALQQKNKTLEQKLNDLKNIEKTMIERNTKTP